MCMTQTALWRHSEPNPIDDLLYIITNYDIINWGDRILEQKLIHLSTYGIDSETYF